MSEFKSITGYDCGSRERLAEHDRLAAEMRRESGFGPILNKEQLFVLHGRKYSGQALLDMENRGDHPFPRRIALTERNTGWVATEAFSWFADRIMSREADAQRRSEAIRPMVAASRNSKKAAEAAAQ
jgi:hypothetical protein